MNDVVDSTKSYPVNYYLLDELLLDQQHDLVPQQLDILLKAPANTSILCIFQESLDPQLWRQSLLDLVQSLRTQRPNQKILVLMNVWYANFDWHDLAPWIDSIHFIDFFVMKCWFPLVNPGGVPTNTTWSLDHQQFLFLTGRPNKIHRLRLLYKFMQAGLQDQCTWSFALQPKYAQVCRELLRDISDSEFAEFVKAHTRVLDREYHDWNYVKHFSTVDEFKEIPNNNHFAFVSHDVEIYQNKKFAVISETDFDRPFSFPWITEKTLNHIINRLPFILASEHKTLSLLEDMGFDVYRKFLAIPNYDDPDQVDYLKPLNRCFQFQHYTRQQNFQDFYQSIKDPSWPDIKTLYHETDRYQHIVNECIDTYQEPIQTDAERRLDAIVTNVCAWMENPNMLTDAGEVVEKNYQTFRSLGFKEFGAVRDWCAGFGVDETHTIDLLFNYNFDNSLHYEVSDWVRRSGKSLLC
jgi:hypothetical protein